MAACVGVGFGQPNDPPRIIGVLTGRPEPNGFATDFCWVGDQNGDGYDDLLVSQDRFPNDTLTRVYVFHGGDSLLDDPAFTYTSYEQNLVIGRDVVYLGNVARNEPPMIAFLSVIVNVTLRVDLYSLDVEPENQPVNGLSGEIWNGAAVFHYGFRDRPKDLTNDGYDDFVIVWQTRPIPQLQILYGGEVFDTIPDWSVSLTNVTVDGSGGTYISGGYDVNADGYDDMLVLTWEDESSSVYFSLYLGGSPPDTVPAFHVPANELALTESFTMLPDVNGDGYDDWGAYWFTFRQENDGFYIFFGGEEPDAEPDVRLEGTRGRFIGGGSITGGDINGDGVGDIITFCSENETETSELMLHFGNRWIAEGDGERRADVYLDMTREYGGEYPLYAGLLGAVGDYNGDGVDDFVYGGNNRALVFAGNRGWRADAPQEEPPPQGFVLTLDVAPNPFNNEAVVKFSLSGRSRIKLSLFDTTGRILKHLAEGEYSAGNFTANLSGLESGLYFAILETPQNQIVRKVVCLK